MSRIDVWCPGWSSGGRHKRAFCRHFARLGYPVVGDERAQHAWVKKKGLHLALISLSLGAGSTDEAAAPQLALTARQLETLRGMLVPGRDDAAAAFLAAAEGGSGAVAVKMAEPSKFAHTAQREARFWEQRQQSQQAAEPEPEPEPELEPEPEQDEPGQDEPEQDQAAFVSSTLGLPNRVRDLNLVNTHLRVPEAGSAAVRLWERHVQRDAADGPQTLLAVGYRRVLLGDHGPYFELERRHLRLEAFAAEPPKELLHYIERYSASGAKLYEQLRTVESRPNPPKEGRYWCANDRPEGYADYRVGLFYLSCDHVRVDDGEGSELREMPLDFETESEMGREAARRRLMRG